MKINFSHIADTLHQGEIIAYPTEGVFGLGCDPLNENAVKKLLLLKQRSIEKGLIIIASDWQQVAEWIAPLSAERWAVIKNTKIPTTWLLPATAQVPAWIRGIHPSVAIRVTHHPIARELCLAFGGPLISTSANIATQPPCKNFAEAQQQFGAKIAYVVEGKVGGLNQPTPIRDAITGTLLRA